MTTKPLQLRNAKTICTKKNEFYEGAQSGCDHLGASLINPLWENVYQELVSLPCVGAYFGSWIKHLRFPQNLPSPKL